MSGFLPDFKRSGPISPISPSSCGWAANTSLTSCAAPCRSAATPSESREALSYPCAFWGFIVAFGVMVAWGMAAGMSLGLSLMLWVMYLVIAVVLSRVVAEGGLLFVHHTWMPLGALAHLVGAGTGSWLLSPAHGIVTASFMESATIQDFRGSLMPSFVQSFKLAYDRQIAGKPLFLLLFTVIILGMVMSFQMNVRLGYQHSGLTLQSWLSRSGPQAVGNNISQMATLSQPVDWSAWFWMGVSALFTYGMMLARSRFAWFPLHPLGYVMSLTAPMWAFWLSIFLGWLCKGLITRFGGHDTYRKTTPAFLGLALGDVSMMLFWIVIDGWQGHTGHQLMPG